MNIACGKTVICEWGKKITPYISCLSLWLLAGVLVVFSMSLSGYYLKPGGCTGHYFGYDSWYARWDGQWYNWIVDKGYHFPADPYGYGPQVFFPLYPLLGKGVQWLSGWDSQISLLTVSWLASAIFSCLWVGYCHSHPKKVPENAMALGLALILFWPAAYFLRVNYTESLYILGVALLFLGMARKWSLESLIFICGLITAIRPTGVVCVVVLVIHSWRRLKDKEFLPRAGLVMMIGLASAWGLYCYMLYLGIVFGDPINFYTRQSAWNFPGQGADPLQDWKTILTFRPVWGFLPDGGLQSVASYPYDLQNRVSWALAWIVLLFGICKRWLTLEEVAFCVMSLLLFYYFNSLRGMNSIGRYVLTVLPLFPVMGRMMAVLPQAVQIGIIALFAALLFLNGGMFNVMHCMF